MWNLDKTETLCSIIGSLQPSDSGEIHEIDQRRAELANMRIMLDIAASIGYEMSRPIAGLSADEETSLHLEDLSAASLRLQDIAESVRNIQRAFATLSNTHSTCTTAPSCEHDALVAAE